MSWTSALRYAVTAFILIVGVAALDGQEASGQPDILQQGAAGFVVHEWGTGGARGTTACPNGRSLGYRQIFEQSAEGQRRDGETDEQYGGRVQAGGFSLATLNGQNLCANPALAPDPHYRTMDDTSVVSYGIDLDGQDTRASGRAASGTCAHNDFRGANGVRGIDNQYLRLVGCTGAPRADAPVNHTGWLPPQQERQENTMLEGGWGVLISLRGVDNLRNDDSVEVGIYANNDPIQLGPTQEPIVHATYAADQDPRFRGETRGRIVDGVLITEPVNVRFHWLVAGLHLERPLDHARIEARFNAHGVLEGYLAGYTPIEAAYDMQYGFRNATDDMGRPAPAAQVTAIATGGASAMGRTCNGAYAALQRLADGDRDPATGRCSSISTQYYFRATPAFVVDTETRSLNDDLVRR